MPKPLISNAEKTKARVHPPHLQLKSVFAYHDMFHGPCFSLNVFDAETT